MKFDAAFFVSASFTATEVIFVIIFWGIGGGGEQLMLLLMVGWTKLKFRR